MRREVTWSCIYLPVPFPLAVLTSQQHMPQYSCTMKQRDMLFKKSVSYLNCRFQTVNTYIEMHFPPNFALRCFLVDGSLPHSFIAHSQLVGNIFLNLFFTIYSWETYPNFKLPEFSSEYIYNLITYYLTLLN